MTTASINDVTMDVVVDQLGRTVVVVEDDLAVHLRALSLHGWVEVSGVNYGYSAPIEPDTDDGALLATVLAAVAEHSPDLLTRTTAADGSFYGHIVGRSDWDDARSWWTDYQAHVHLHPVGSIQRSYNSSHHWRFQG